MAWEGPWRDTYWGRNYAATWRGAEQVEDKSRANVARCYDYLLSRPYLSAEDRERIETLKFIQVLKAKA